MTIPSNIQPFWDKFQTTVDYNATARFCEAYYFADSEQVANKLADLVLEGTKRATAGLLWAYEAEDEAVPKVGELYVITDWKGDPKCVIEIKVVDIVPFDAVTEEFAAIEGEGDKSLRYWKEAHWGFFGRECEQIGKERSLEMLVVCEQFAVVYP